MALVLDLWRRPDNLGERLGIDFHTYLAAAVVGLQQGWSHIYDQALVTAAQEHLVPTLKSQPFLSPPTMAWIVAPLTLLPFWVAYGVWAVFTFGAFAAALAWSGVSTGIARWVAVIGALSPWWVIHSVDVGQGVLLVAAGVVVAWRLLREKKDIAAGVVLSLIFLKPNTAILVPFALLVAGRYRAFVSWVAAGAVIGLIAAVTLGTHGLSAYVTQLLAPLPSGADNLTLTGALGVTGVTAFLLRLLIVAMMVVTAFKLRASPGLVMPVGVLASMVVAPYLHGSDLCLLSVAAWIVWEERTELAWRVALAAGWILSSPFLVVVGHSPGLTRVALGEYVLLLALVVVAWRPLTRVADLRTRAPA